MRTGTAGTRSKFEEKTQWQTKLDAKRYRSVRWGETSDRVGYCATRNTVTAGHGGFPERIGEIRIECRGCSSATRGRTGDDTRE